MEYSRDATPCQWGRLVVAVWGGGGCNISGWGGVNALANPVLEY